MTYLPCVEVEPTVKATASVIWLHGLGSNGHDFEALLPELQLPADMPVRFIFPHAASISVTINGGAVMPAWYDIISLDVSRKLNVDQLIDSAQCVIDLIEREISRGIASERIILAGFSQGGAVVYHAALSYAKPLAGLLTLSTYFPTSNIIQYSDANRDIAIEIMHGSDDPVVVPKLGEMARDDLIAADYHPQWRTYPMEHQVCMPEIQDIAQWITARLS
ncbi:alpha/beta hydrolase [Photobacterium carnosum]|uniref:alpha/beta hydrolase n=1 Tax=Photobacterium carnosum TaxID=2023717 RepID=UPI00128BACC3|nr:carboxylesterase [Photobacterium carnosum]MCD9495300.1 carboxylesterase [Photobacterium carnosum]MCD9521925.1 carboxylesterase [Photobacterium carnosum]MCD9529733.1 carboxylesterase [Photobacterium carnosum]MCD9536252.1 carboxylesterase [Photobacterium carnosum]